MANRRVLIIDDDPEIQEVYRSILVPGATGNGSGAELFRLLNPETKPGSGEDRAFELDFALQGEQGFELVRDSVQHGRPYALAFIDIRMPPGWDGMKTAAEIRRLDPNVELVIVTAYSDRSLAEIVQAVGAPDKLLFLRKPFDPEEVYQMALSLTEKWNLARQTDELVRERTADLRSVNKELQRQVCAHKRAEKALRQAYDEFYQIFDTASDGMQVIDQDFTIVRVNEAFADLVGLAKEKVIGRKCFEVFGGASCHTADCPLTQIIEGRHRVEYEEERERQDGSRVPIINTSYPFREPDGELIGIVSSVKNITKWKKVERTLRAFAAELERSNDDLQNFAYTVSHDLQEPLVLIRAFGKRLLEKHGGKLDENAREYLTRIDGSAKRMQDLIEGLLIFSRVTSDRRSFSAVDLAEVTDNVVADLEMRIKNSGGQVIVGELPTVDADPVQMHQLFLNLVGNALKYHSPDRPPRVEVSGVRSYDQVLDRPVCTVTVKDNGIGFEEAYVAQIFGIFQRLHNRNKYEGTGIGLAICKRIVERHGGEIGAKSRPGEGSEFSVTLPLRREAEGHRPLNEFELILDAPLSETP